MDGQKAVNGIAGGSSIGVFHTIGSESVAGVGLAVTPDMTGGGGKGLKVDVAVEVLDVVLV